jgi:hypothetical protein
MAAALVASSLLAAVASAVVPTVDREVILAELKRRFPDAAPGDVAAAANAIVGLDDEWQEVSCTSLGDLLERLRHGAEFRLLERLPSRD